MITYRAEKGSALTNAEVDANFAQLANGSIEGFLQSGGIARSWLSKAREIVSVKDFGATGDGTTDDTTAIQAAIDAVKAGGDDGGGVVYLPKGVYRTTATLNLDDDGIHLLGDGSWGIANLDTVGAGEVGKGEHTGATRILGDFTSGPVIHISDDSCGVEGITVDGSDDRKAAALTTTNCGILIESADTASGHTYGFLIRRVRVCNQPGHGILAVNAIVSSTLDSVNVDHVNGHGIFIAGGFYTTRTNKTRPGQVDIINCKASRTGGHSLKVGGADAEDDSNDIPYRIHVYNFETFYNCITPSICENYVSASTDVSNGFISGENHYVIGSAFDGRTDRLTVVAAHSCIQWRGLFIDNLNCRYIDGNPYSGRAIGHPLLSSVSKDITVTSPYISNVSSPITGAGFYNPAFFYGSDVFGFRAISQSAFSNTTSLTSRVSGSQFYELFGGTERKDFTQIRVRAEADKFRWREEFSLDDNESGYVDMGSVTRGVLVVSGNVGDAGSATVHFRVGDANAHASIASSTGPTVTGTTGALDGTTGVDGQLTISGDTATNRLYIENRTGAARSYVITFLSTQQATTALFSAVTTV